MFDSRNGCAKVCIAPHFPNFTFERTMTDWTRLESRPNHTNEELRLTRVSGNVSEFENRSGCRYRCVTEGGVTQWFGSPTNKVRKRATRAGIQICCKKLERSFGTFIDRASGPGRLVSIFPKRSGLSSVLSSGINFCPWCGKKIQFLQSENSGESCARTAKAGARWE